MEKELVSLPNLYQVFFDENGFPLVGGKLYTYRAKTNIKQDTYKDAGASALNTNPIILDANGACRIFISSNKEKDDEGRDIEIGYRFELFDKNDRLVYTEDNIFAINGIDGKNTGIIVQGPPGEPGEPGISVIGPDGKTGDVGPMGRDGMVTMIVKKLGLTELTVEKDVTKMNVTLIGGGGGFLYEGIDTVGKNVCSGFAGKILNFDVDVTQGDVFKVYVGKGGIVSNNLSTASGEASTFEYRTITKQTAKGGVCGYLNGAYGVSYYERVNPYISEVLSDGKIIEIIPLGISGEDCPPYGQAGSPSRLTKDKPDATGYGASGGTLNPVITDGAAVVKSTMCGVGAQGVCIITYKKDVKEVDNESDKVL